MCQDIFNQLIKKNCVGPNRMFRRVIPHEPHEEHHPKLCLKTSEAWSFQPKNHYKVGPYQLYMVL